MAAGAPHGSTRYRLDVIGAPLLRKKLQWHFDSDRNNRVCIRHTKESSETTATVQNWKNHYNISRIALWIKKQECMCTLSVAIAEKLYSTRFYCSRAHLSKTFQKIRCGHFANNCRWL